MNRKYLYIFLILLVLVGVLSYNYVYQDHKDIKNETASIKLNSQDLILMLTDDDLENDKLILDQVIEVTGVATDKAAQEMTLDFNVFIQLANPTKFPLNHTYTVKGRCIGYDDLLGEVKIDQAYILNPQNSNDHEK
ncbi:hypothetical protein [Nonlabens sp. MIC269]|uniref:OB-fold protein n=1 Tax=Nonlabens sp. MIC269 TaxID=1476901 RepID=UPI000760D36E|nr:hypothetical protein [Nonlabens sp. MIC269]